MAQTEAVIATLHAYHQTNDGHYLKLFNQAYDWALRHFKVTYGEWYGYLHRDGSLSVDLKGNIYKGPSMFPGCSWKESNSSLNGCGGA